MTPRGGCSFYAQDVIECNSCKFATKGIHSHETTSRSIEPANHEYDPPPMNEHECPVYCPHESVHSSIHNSFYVGKISFMEPKFQDSFMIPRDVESILWELTWVHDVLNKWYLRLVSKQRVLKAICSKMVSRNQFLSIVLSLSQVKHVIPQSNEHD